MSLEWERLCPLPRNSLPIYALLCERIYSCHLDNDTENLVTEPLSRNGRSLWFWYSGFRLHATILNNSKIQPYMSWQRRISLQIYILPTWLCLYPWKRAQIFLISFRTSCVISTNVKLLSHYEYTKVYLTRTCQELQWEENEANSWWIGLSRHCKIAYRGSCEANLRVIQILNFIYELSKPKP
jgi:hypothetical protein